MTKFLKRLRKKETVFTIISLAAALTGVEVSPESKDLITGLLIGALSATGIVKSKNEVEKE